MYRNDEVNEIKQIAADLDSSQIVSLNEWLTYISGAIPVLNAAIGYQWDIREGLLLITGFRTDFNYMKDLNSEDLIDSKTLMTIGVDNYHFSGGLSWNVLGQDIVTGLQYTLGIERDQRQVINLSDPVEFNYDEMAPLRGTRQNTMTSIINGVSIYFGATFNFGGE